MIYLLPAVLVATAIMAGILIFQGAFRVKAEPNALPLKNRRVGRLTVDIPETADKVDHWHCTLVIDPSLSLLWMEEIVIDRLAQADDQSGRLEWELDILVRKEKNLDSALKWKEVDLENQFDRPARLIIGRARVGNPQNLNWERVNYAFWAAFPGGFLKISGLPLSVEHDQQDPAETARQLEQGESRFKDWVRKVLADYHWLGGLDEAAPEESLRTGAGYLDGEMGRAAWNVSAAFKSADPALSFSVWYEHEPDPYPDVYKEENFLGSRAALLLLLRVIRGLSGDPGARQSANSFKSITVNRVRGREYLMLEYDADGRPIFGASWQAEGRPSAGRPKIHFSAGAEAEVIGHRLEEKDIPAFLGTWQAMLQSLRWSKG